MANGENKGKNQICEWAFCSVLRAQRWLGSFMVEGDKFGD